MLKKAALCVAALLAVSGVSPAAIAAISDEDADRLGDELTPLGADPGASADGSIPAWEGGVTSQADAGFPDFETGGHHPDPFDNDEIGFHIDADNMAEYAELLTPGQQAMLEAYPTFRMNVYPTRRSAAFPQRIYEATRNIATKAALTDNGNGVENAIIGIPFPIPASGLEAIWNHILRYRADAADRQIAQAPVTRSGGYTLVKFQDQFLFPYSLSGATVEGLDNVIIYFIQKVVAPPRLAGEILLVHETLDQAREHRKAWLYNPGQRRVRRAPNVAFDNPGTAADGLRTSDQFDMYNGSPERYDWELIGKREMYVPYNSYKLHSDQIQYSDILQPLHMNPELLRYEKHRVWVVDAKLKPGTSHIYKRRTFYIDEDSWQILLVDCYDNRDQIWRVQEGHVINYYDVPNLWTTVEATYDLQSGRYLTLNMNNEESITYNFDVSYTAEDFSPSALRRAGTR
ncbi:MAG: DUF1329 domain-containing protein [Gammaproteobacteria bacterium]|nr:DUF1329 domain-containing protein [Gammaproteobacteria bacterium]